MNDARLARPAVRAIRIDLPLCGAVLLLCLYGLAVVWSASSLLAIERFGTPNAYFTRQLTFFAAGLCACLALANVPFVHWRHPAVKWGLLAASLAGLLAVFAFPARNGAHRWVKLPGFNAQPSDIAKLALIVLVADHLAARVRIFDDRARARADLRTAALCLLPLVLILREPDLGTTVVLAGTLLAMLFAAGLPWRWLLAAGGSGLAGIALLIAASPYRRQRIFAFMNPDAADGAAYQITQAKLALGAGGLTGKWFMGGALRLLYLPEPHTDCVFASLGEETGLIGTTLVLAGFLFVLWRGLRIAREAPTPFGRHLAFALTVLIGAQSFFNLLVVTGMAPPKGIALPFLSYGGSSLVVSLAMVGILLNISQHGRNA